MDFNPEITANISKQVSVNTDDRAYLAMSDRRDGITIADRVNSLTVRVSESIPITQSLVIENEITATDNFALSEAGLFQRLDDSLNISEGVSYRQIQVSDYIQTAEKYYNSIAYKDYIASIEETSAVTGYNRTEDSLTVLDFQNLFAYLNTADSIETDGIERITAYLFPKERILSISKIPEILATLPVLDYFNEFSDNVAIENTDVTTSLKSFFPDYFYDQGPYKELINLLGYRASLNYNLAELIRLVYDVDSLPDSYVYYNKLLKLIGLDFDFSALPSAIIRNILNSYLSIRKYRGTKASILAVLRLLDLKFLENPNNLCPLNISLNDITTESGFVIEKGLLSIEYANLNFPEAAEYLISKVIPTGLAYELVSKYLYLEDSLDVEDYGEAINKELYTISVRDAFPVRDTRSYFEFPVKDRLAIMDYRNSAFSDRVFMREASKLFIKVSDVFTAVGQMVNNTLSVEDENFFSIEKTRYIYGGKIVETSDSLTASEHLENIADVPWELKVAIPEYLTLSSRSEKQINRYVSDSMLVNINYRVEADLLYKNVQDEIDFSIAGGKQPYYYTVVSENLAVSENAEIRQSADALFRLSENTEISEFYNLDKQSGGNFHVNDSCLWLDSITARNTIQRQEQISIADSATAREDSTQFVNFSYYFDFTNSIQGDTSTPSRGAVRGSSQPDRVIRVSERINIDFVD